MPSSSGLAPRTCEGDTTSSYSYSTFDVTGDGHVDLVMTRDRCDEAGLGISRWKVYAGVCP